MVYKIKTKSNGSVERYKALLVARRFTQEYGIDYEEIFVSVAKMTSFTLLLPLLLLDDDHSVRWILKMSF